jgi:CheY-like chemotaxis protein
MAHQRAEYLDAGMNGLVGKPISQAALLAEIDRVIAETGAFDAAGAVAAEAG